MSSPTALDALKIARTAWERSQPQYTIPGFWDGLADGPLTPTVHAGVPDAGTGTIGEPVSNLSTLPRGGLEPTLAAGDTQKEAKGKAHRVGRLNPTGSPAASVVTLNPGAEPCCDTGLTANQPVAAAHATSSDRVGVGASSTTTEAPAETCAGSRERLQEGL